MGDVLMTGDQLDALLERAAERGAEKALRELGLYDEVSREELAQARSIGRALGRVQDRVGVLMVNAISATILTVFVFGLYTFARKYFY